MRSLGDRRVDTRRTLRGYSSKHLKTYIGSKLMAALVADDELFKQHGVRVLSPGLRGALTALEPLAVGEES